MSENRNIIRSITLTNTEINERDFLLSFEWPRDRHEIMKLGYERVKLWLHYLHPRTSLLITSSHSFQNRLRLLKRKWSFKEKYILRRKFVLRKILKEYRELYCPYVTKTKKALISDQKQVISTRII